LKKCTRESWRKMLYVIAGDQSRELKVNKIIKEIKEKIQVYRRNILMPY